MRGGGILSFSYQLTQTVSKQLHSHHQCQNAKLTEAGR